jgi:PAS domain S-box-containing protein
VDKEKVLDYVFAHQCVTKINDAMLEQYRAGREQFIGLTPNDFFAHDLEQGRRIWREFFDSGHLDVETDERRFDGTQMWIEGHYVCMHDNEGRITGHFGIQRDITARRQAEEQIRKLSQAVEQSPTSIVITDKDGDIEYVNPKFEQLTGYSFEEARGKNPRILKSGEQSLEYYQDLWKTIKGGKVWRGVFHNRRKDGSLFWESEIIAPILDQAGQIVNYVAVKEDVTARIVAEENLNLAMKQLEQSNNELRTFAYAASHELQEPLRMVSSYVQLLARRYQDKLDSDAAEFIGFALEGADRMKKLIDNLLEYSRIGTHGKGFTKTDCNQVVRQALDNLQIEIKESGAQVAAERLPELLADETQLIALFQNLVGNAVKFRGKQAPQVSIRAEAREADWVFAVQDNGIGLDPRDAERVFDVFQRLHTREEYPGTGIGLSLCKRIVERHGGKIWVKSQSDRGATFYFTLPNGERK